MNNEADLTRAIDVTIDAVIRHLTKSASDPARIGRRVLAWKWAIDQKDTGVKLREIARLSGLSIPRCSSAIGDAQSAFFDLKREIAARLREQREGGCWHDE